VTLDRPWALLLVAALPVLWWLHRRAAPPQVVRVASLLPFRTAGGVPARQPRRAFDLVLASLLAAAALLALSAAQPRFGSIAESVYVVLDESPSGTARPADALRRAEELLPVRRRPREGSSILCMAWLHASSVRASRVRPPSRRLPPRTGCRALSRRTWRQLARKVARVCSW
jgi:hypothetical protein